MAERRRIPWMPTLALVGALFAIWYVMSRPTVVPPPPASPPPKAPFPNTLAGAGVLEPADSRTTAVGAPFAGLVLVVFHDVGDAVRKGDTLFRLDDRVPAAQRPILEARLATAKADVAAARAAAEAAGAKVATAEAARAAAQAKVDRLLAMPRKEELPPLEAKVAEAEAVLADWRGQVARWEAAAKADPGVVSADELARRQYGARAAEQSLAGAQASLALAKAGAWAPDVAEAKTAVAQAESAIAEAKALAAQSAAGVATAQAREAEAKATLESNDVDLQRATVTSPIDGTVLDVAVRAGEFTAANRDALMRLGDLRTLLVRMDVDEESVPLVRANARAQGVVRGFPDRPFPLEFVRIEPWVRPKVSLTGATNERVDTRVLQVIFRAGASPLPLYVGQQVDVFMEGRPRDEMPAGSAAGAGSGQPPR